MPAEPLKPMLRPALGTALLVLAVGCGQKGPLYLPEEEPAAEEVVQPQPVEQEQQQQEPEAQEEDERESESS